MLRTENLYKSYDGKENNVIKNVSIEFAQRGLVFLLGKSGSGKTTLLNMLGGIDKPTGGDIYLADKRFSSLTEKQMDEMRNVDISFVFQDFNLLQDLNVLENVILPLQIQMEEKGEEDKRNKLAKEMLEKVGLQEYETRMPNELSGGQVQRVAIARAMIKSPRVLLADEPTGNLDSANSQVVFEALRKMAESCLVVVVTHDEESAYKYGDRVIHIVDGSISSDVQLDRKNVEIEYSIVKNDVLIKSDISGSANVNNIITEELSKCVLEEDDVNIKVALKKIKKQNVEQEVQIVDRKQIEIKPFTLKEIIKFAKNNMKNHKKHIFATIVMMLLTIMLIMLSAMLSDYNSIEPIEKYLNEYQIDRVNLYEEVEYTNSFEECKGKTLSVGEYFESTLGSKLLDNRIKVIEKEYIDYKQKFFSYCNVFMLTDDYGICNDIRISEGEVVITDYVAEHLGIGSNPVGEKLTIGSKLYTIIACIDSVKNPELAEKFNLYDDEQDMYESYYLDNFYNVVFLNEADVMADRVENNKCISTECADFLNARYERYYTRMVNISSTKLIEEGDILYGEYPDEPNEVLISTYYAYDNGLMTMDGQFSDELFTMEFDFKDVHSGYNNYFSDTLNMDDYFDGKVRISGVYSELDYSADYMICDDIYQKMLEDYYEKYNYDRSVLYVEAADYHDIISHIEGYNSKIDEPSINKIYDFESMIGSIKNAIIFLLSVLIVIAIFMVYHNIYISISYNKKTIGVLRSIGVSKRCTMKIFLVEAIVICTLSCIFATIFGVLVMNFVNKTVRAGVKINPYDLLLWDYPMSIVITLGAFVLFLFTAIIPILNYAKKQPIQVIRNN